MNNVKSIFLSALVTGIVTIAATLLINYISTKSNSLIYTTQESIPFIKDSSTVRILSLELINNGDDAVENISGFINFGNQRIENYKLNASPVLSFSDSLNKDGYRISLSSLNPNEKVS